MDSEDELKEIRIRMTHGFNETEKYLSHILACLNQIRDGMGRFRVFDDDVTTVVDRNPTRFIPKGAYPNRKR
jgi:hypothetical protein